MCEESFDTSYASGVVMVPLSEELELSSSFFTLVDFRADIIWLKDNIQIMSNTYSLRVIIRLSSALWKGGEVKDFNNETNVES